MGSSEMKKFVCSEYEDDQIEGHREDKVRCQDDDIGVHYDTAGARNLGGV